MSNVSMTPLSEMARDAARYRWLREQVSTKETMLKAQALFWDHTSRKQFDKAVDEALGASRLSHEA